jgi:uncharacterized protein (DUF362 family)
MAPFDPKKAVAIAAGRDRRALVREVLAALGEPFSNLVSSARRILIHPNLVTHFRQAASTHVEAVRGVIDHVSLLRGDEILIGDAGYHDTKKAFPKYDYPSLERSGNIRLVDLNDDETVESFAYDAELKKRPIGFSRTVAESENAPRAPHPPLHLPRGDRAAVAGLCFSA